MARGNFSLSFVVSKIACHDTQTYRQYLGHSALLLAVFLLIGSFEAAVFTLKRAAADGHLYVYMAKQFLADPTSFVTYAPPPGHGFVPEVFICIIFCLLFPQMAAWQIIGLANITMSLLFVFLLSYVLPNSLARSSLHNTEHQLPPLPIRLALACTLLALLNFANSTSESYFGLDATNGHLGSYATSLVLVALIFGRHNRNTQALMMAFCALGLMSSKLVLASAVAPLMLTLFWVELRRKTLPHMAEVKGMVLLIALSLFTLIPVYLFSDLEALQRTNLSLDNILPTLAIWELYVKSQTSDFSGIQFIYLAISAIFLIHIIKNARHPMSLAIASAFILCFVASLLAGTFRGWNLRYLGGGFFLAAGFFIALQTKFARPTLLALLVTVSLMAWQNNYNFTYPETREQKLAECLRPLWAEGTIKRGLAGHWDSEPVNNFLGERVLIKTTLRSGTPQPYQWIVDTQWNNFEQDIDFAIENKANGFYRLNAENLRALPGHKGAISCPNAANIIHLYDSDVLSGHLRN